MIYNGQNDVILGPPPAENFIRTIPWSGQLEYLATPKIIWKVQSSDSEVLFFCNFEIFNLILNFFFKPAGYVRQTGSFVQVVIRDAGHMVPTDQPRAAYDMISRFINNQPFTNN